MDPLLQKWLEFAPKPQPLETSQRWHVFLSYRSVNRHWVLQLYDVLRHLGYNVFLDQYVLSAAAPLALTLSEELDRSASAIMMWSTDFNDSNWCLKEFTTLESKENAGNGFRYVIAKLDTFPLPGLAASKIYVDFADLSEGPGGSGLLRLLYGLAGNPLPAGAITFAEQIDEDTRNDRLTIRAARASGDNAIILSLCSSDTVAWKSSPALSCEAAEALIALGDYPNALRVLADVARNFPRALRPQQLTGLAMARSGDLQQAQIVLGRLYAAGEIDPETLGIYGRTWMDRYYQTKDRLHLLRSRDLYRQAFEAAPKDFYTGINAASKSLLLGERDTAGQLAARVEKIVGTTAVPNDYWRTATIAEVQLLQDNYEQAAALYQSAVGGAPLERGSHQSTWRQASCLLDCLGASAEQRKLISNVFPSA
ncbi:MAG: TRAFs-binding domain-containing protein [Acidobacteriota bacterium]